MLHEQTQKRRFPPVITSSMLSDGGACEELFNKRYVRRIVPEQASIHLVAGAAFAEGLKRSRVAFYKEGKGEEAALLAGARGVLEVWEIEEVVRHNKNIGSIILALDYYFTQCPLATDHLQPAKFANGSLGIEFNFSIPIPFTNPDTGDPLLYEGRCDMLSPFAKSLAIVDEKTTGQLGATWSSQFNMRSQFLGYCWATRYHGYNTNLVYVRQIAIRSRDFELAETAIIFPPHLIDRWYSNTLCKKVARLIKAYKEEDFEFDFADKCTAYGGCGMRDFCKQINQEEIPVGFKEVEKLYYER